MKPFQYRVPRVVAENGFPVTRKLAAVLMRTHRLAKKNDTGIELGEIIMFRTCVTRNIPTALVVAVLLTLAACGGGGGGGGSSSGSGGSTPTGTVSVYPRFAYVANDNDNSVSVYAVNATTGRLTFTGKVSAGTNPYSVTVDPSGRYAYVVNLGDGTVSQYTIGSNGSLTPMSPATVSAGAQPSSVTTTGSYQ